MYLPYLTILILAAATSAYSAAVKVIGGSNATQGEFPYQILIKIAQPSNPEQVPFCGGTLVVVNNTQVVLSSATCVSGEDIEGLSLVAGELNPYVESGWEQYRNVSDCTFYGFYLDDIAVIIPETPFELNEQVKPARLPSTPYMPSEGEVIITGWGDLKPYNWDDPQVPKPAEILQKIKMKLLSEEECIEQLFPIFDVQPYHLCTALVNGTATDPCWGDLGGPVYSIEGDYLAGIVGVGATCAWGEQYPGFHIEVSHFLDWIENVVNSGTSTREEWKCENLRRK